MSVWKGGEIIPKYFPAVICEKGHIISSFGAGEEDRCEWCGSKAVSYCPHCGATIQGSPIEDGADPKKFKGSYEDYPQSKKPQRASSPNYKVPFKCKWCDQPYPWTTQLKTSVEKLIDQSNVYLDPKAKESLMGYLDDLLIESSQPETAIEYWKEFLYNSDYETKVKAKKIFIDFVAAKYMDEIFGTFLLV